MPIALDPNQTAPYSLDGDMGIPADKRPVFVFRILTCRDVLRLDEFVDKARATKDQKEEFALLKEAVRVGLKETRNLPADFDLDTLTASELWELAVGGLKATRLAETDRKNSASQSGSGSGKGAATSAASV